MKRIGTIFIILVILYSVYYDLTIGTLPNGLTEVEVTTIEETETEIVTEEINASVPFDPFQEVTVEPGHTVLSIVEHLHEGPIPASIQEIVFDFQELNGGTKPEEIQIGKAYLFPVYH
ncbi:hypothetical protein [Halalkalibacter akibai]|uniref:LysM domain-containing protein n=1 Tax=Halalkalibacter akibai (strain ATCC 43226 / DSM 21942 / CIP 109018 / JCM 9157 / 1139) TaxID=1236973 RepID=W4QMZ5_HALA3|nr:hypothetical protein [Halalkalibacter akibai]GAE33436.1 hypothetical protein JCM9157_436 [Halalkalibacter akibai JCM 9157]